jgi:hypothetical protein
MPLKDLLQNKLTVADVNTINTALAAIETAIAGKTVNLTPEERQQFGSINEQNKLLVNKINDFKTSHPQHNSPQVDWAEFQADYAARTTLATITSKLESINEQITDTRILHDNDNFQQSLTQYSYISYLSQQNVAGTTGLKEAIAQFFPRTVKTVDIAPETPTT